MPFEVCDISTWPVISQEARGLDAKDWVVPPDQVIRKGQAHWWLYKPVKTASYRRFDDWSEKLASELARLIDLPAARVELAKGVDTEGIISRNVTLNGWSLESGDTLLSEIDGYQSCAGERRPKNRIGHTIQNIVTIMRGATGPPGTEYESWSGIEVFAGYLLFDAWIANTDRHAMNWSVVTHDDEGRQALAPSFDHGSALASGTQDARLITTTPKSFAEGGYASRFEGGHRLTLVDLSLLAVHQVQGRAPVWVDRLRALKPSAWVELLALIPEMSVERRRFLSELLIVNQRRLTA